MKGNDDLHLERPASFSIGFASSSTTEIDMRKIIYTAALASVMAVGAINASYAAGAGGGSAGGAAEVQPAVAPPSDREVRLGDRRPPAWALAITGWATVRAERTPAPTAFQILPVTALCPEVLLERACQHREPGDRVSRFRAKACPGLDSGQGFILL